MTLSTLKKSARGFTLLELLIVVIIIGILAAIAVPQFNKAVKKSRTTEAVGLVGAILNSEYAYYQENAAFVAFADNATLAATTLLVQIPTGSANWTYVGTTVAAAAANPAANPPAPAVNASVKVVATGAANGSYAGLTITGNLDSLGNKSVVASGF